MSDRKESVKSISAEEFAGLNFHEVTLVDLREPGEVKAEGIEGAINIPVERIGRELDSIPKDRKVYVFCKTGELSGEVVENLAEKGYDVYNVTGGYRAYHDYLKKGHPVYVDAREMKSPAPVMAVADALRHLHVGEKLRVETTDESFASDVAVWCKQTGNKLLKLEVKSDLTEAIIQKEDRYSTVTHSEDTVQKDKTFVLFSDELDRVMAILMMANAAASMGRRVTIFCTFWGVNVLRRPEKIKVNKSFLERVFACFAPRGTQRLKLSRRNIMGVGARLMRRLMKSKGISSPEELMQTAIQHGVKFVACRTSMDIMGIKKEELMEGAELGGVQAFLEAGELSDINMFI